VNLAADMDRATASTLAAVEASQFNPLTTAAMAVVLFLGLFALRFVRHWMQSRSTNPAAAPPTASTALPAQFSTPQTVEPTEPPARR
jgi:hypothetical protein